MSEWLEVSLKERIGRFDLDVSFGLGREIGVIFGPSGAGKSLTLRCLSGLQKVRKGRIVLAGRVILDTASGKSIHPCKRRMGILPQGLALFPHMTALENVMYGCNRTGEREKKTCARKWLERVRLEEYGNHYPSQLSGGQKQRVALARALASEPEMLMLDEPFSALDGPLRRNLRRDLRRLQEEAHIPVLYVTHQVEDICALGDKIFFIEKGMLTGSARVEEMLEGSGRLSFWKMMGWGNVLEGRAGISAEGRPVFRWDSGELSLKELSGPGSAVAFVRPDHVRILDPRIPVDEELSKNTFSGEVEEVLLEGGAIRMHVRTPNGYWQVERPVHGPLAEGIRPGEKLFFAVPPGAIELIFLESPENAKRPDSPTVESLSPSTGFEESLTGNPRT